MIQERTNTQCTQAQLDSQTTWIHQALHPSGLSMRVTHFTKHNLSQALSSALHEDEGLMHEAG